MGCSYVPYIPLANITFDPLDQRVIYLKLMFRSRSFDLPATEPPDSVFLIKGHMTMRFLPKYLIGACMPAYYWLKNNRIKIETIEEHIESNEGFNVRATRYAKLTLERVEDVVLFKMFCT